MGNNIDIKKLFKENTVIAVAVIVVVAVFIVYFTVFAPLLKEIKLKYLECGVCENQIVEARDLISYASGLDKTYGGRILISEKDAASAIDELAKDGKSLGIDIISMKPQDIVVKESAPYKILPVDMVIESPDEKFVDFIGSVSSLQKALVRIKAFEVYPDKDDRTKLKANLTLEMYLSTKDTAG